MLSSLHIAKGLRALIERDGYSVKDVVNAFISFCAKYNLNEQLPRVLEVLEAEHKRVGGEQSLVITSAHKLEATVIQAVKKRLGAPSDVACVFEEDASLHAGVTALCGDKFLDASASSKIRDIERAIVNG
ncbi:MAG: F0F1 ATP synthase subunit delta [bacterium]|nr:F0F1 ATP synthase subunit delta [bacterium]